MKLLFDENVSHKLAGSLTAEFPGSVHVRDLGLRGADDQQIWAHARKQGFVIVSMPSACLTHPVCFGLR